VAQLDRQHRIIRTRIVYAGAAGAGKSTNLQQVGRLFEATQPSTTGAVESIVALGGRVGPYALHAEIVAISGRGDESATSQARLVRSADCVVLVCSSTPRGVDASREHLRALRAALHAPWGRVPLVVQANKQDERDALEPEQVATSLDVGAKLAVVAARALEGVGVRETFVLALRAVAASVQRLLTERELPTADDETTGPAGSPPLVPFPPDAPSSPGPPSAPDARVEARDLWPAARRDVLRRLASVEHRRRADLAGRQGADDGSGTSDVTIVQAGDFCLKTSGRRRFTDAVSARTAMAGLVRKKELIEHLTPTDTVLCLRHEADGSIWLWTIARWVTTLRSAMAHAQRRGDETALGEALASFATMAVDSMVLNVTRSVVLDVHPSNFGFLGERMFYVDDDIGVGPRNPAIGHALLRRFEEYAGHGRAVQQYLTIIQHQITTRLTPGEAAGLGIAAALEGTPARSVVAHEARAQLCRMLSRYTAPATD
jgi:signal recognition particle receptor subunit beta